MLNRIIQYYKSQVLGVVLALLPFAAPAETTNADDVYSGMLGKQKIVMRIKISDSGTINGSYFYTNYHRDIPLTGTRDGQRIQLAEGAENAPDLPQFDLNLKTDGDWSGLWTNAQGKTLKVMLRRARAIQQSGNTDRYVLQLRDKNLYEYLRLSGLTLRPGRRASFMGYTLQWWIEPDSKISLFEIVDGYPDDMRRNINQALRDRLWHEVSTFHQCMLDGSRFSGADFNQIVTPKSLTSNVVSVSVFTSYFCGGAHPDFGDNPINLDARTGHALTLEDVLWVGSGKPFYYHNDVERDWIGADDKTLKSVSFDTFSTYREHDLAPWLVKRFTTLYGSRLKDDERWPRKFGQSDKWIGRGLSQR